MKNVDLRKTGNIISMQDIEAFEENAGVSLSRRLQGISAEKQWRLSC